MPPLGPPAPLPMAAQRLREATEAFQRQWLEGALLRHRGSLAGAACEARMDRSNLRRLASAWA
jgi:anaerobic nitric oxide reductase transcription regulator